MFGSGLHWLSGYICADSRFGFDLHYGELGNLESLPTEDANVKLSVGQLSASIADRGLDSESHNVYILYIRIREV